MGETRGVNVDSGDPWMPGWGLTPSSHPGPVHFVWWYEVMGTWYWGWPYTLLFSLQLPVLSLDTKIALPVLYLLYCQVRRIHSRSRFLLRRPCLVLSRKFPKAVSFCDLFELKRNPGVQSRWPSAHWNQFDAPFEIKNTIQGNLYRKLIFLIQKFMNTRV